MIKQSKRNTFLIDLGDTDEANLLMENLNQYIRLTGWSRKRFYLLGAAAVIGKSGENTALVEQIANYLSDAGSRHHAGRRKQAVTES